MVDKLRGAEGRKTIITVTLFVTIAVLVAVFYFGWCLQFFTSFQNEPLFAVPKSGVSTVGYRTNQFLIDYFRELATFGFFFLTLCAAIAYGLVRRMKWASWAMGGLLVSMVLVHFLLLKVNIEPSLWILKHASPVTQRYLFLFFFTLALEILLPAFVISAVVDWMGNKGFQKRKQG
jgi:hypothetical protein